MKRYQPLILKQSSVYDVFLMSIEWLEKYIEIVYKSEFPNWENRKQVRDNLTIKRTDIYRNHKKLEETLSTQLALLESSVEEEPLRDELKQEFYKWISATGIDANNCPEKLKHYLFGVNEILEGRGWLGITDQFLLQNNTNTKNILLVGYTGNGKSTLANVLTGTDFFREGGYCVGETKNIKSVEFKCEGSNYRIIDTPGFGDTSLTEKEILNKIAEAVHEARDGITQIFFIIGGRFSKAEIDTYEAVYKLFSKAICDENVAKYITIVRTHFKDFKNEGECQTDINLMLNDHGELSEIITEVINEGGKGKIIHVDNDTFQLRTDSRKILLDRLQKCRGVYKPESIDELNRKISGSLREKQDLLEEVNLLKREIDNLKKWGQTSDEEIYQLQDQLQEKDERINSLSQTIYSQTMQHMEERTEKRSEIREWLDLSLSAFSTVATMVSTGCKIT